MAADPTQQSTHIEFASEQERTYFAQAVLGIEAREFLNSAVGRFLHGCAKQELNDCTAKLLKLNPYTPEGKREWEQLQLRAACAENFIKWCIEMINSGDNAEKHLEEYRDGEE